MDRWGISNTFSWCCTFLRIFKAPNSYWKLLHHLPFLTLCPLQMRANVFHEAKHLWAVLFSQGGYLTWKASFAFLRSSCRDWDSISCTNFSRDTNWSFYPIFMLALLWGGCGSGSGGNASHPIIRSSSAVLIPKIMLFCQSCWHVTCTHEVSFGSLLCTVLWQKKTDGLQVHILALTSSFST